MNKKKSPEESAKKLKALEEISKLKASHINEELAKRPDILARNAIESASLDLDFSDCKDLMISYEALQYVKGRGFSLPSVFAHPRLLMSAPITSLHYRGISGMSSKSVRMQTKIDVRKLESKTDSLGESAFDNMYRLARLYNMMTSFVITNSVEWTLENGYRSIIATLGISLDGQMRNKYGQLAEARIKKVICDYLKDTGWLPHNIQDASDAPSTIILGSDNKITEVRFGSEPDIGFYDAGGNPLVVIEIKGGLDPAGALERFGAVQKTAREAKKDSPDCKVFLVASEITPQMKQRLETGEKIVENFFDLFDIIQDEERRKAFLDEIFR